MVLKGTDVTTPASLRTLAPALLLALLHTAAASAGQAHDHGHARLDIAVEGKRITMQLASPLDNLLGFERAPRTEAERKSAAALESRLREVDALFKPDPAAQCRLATVEIESAALKLGRAEPEAKAAEHADLDTRIEFDCADASRAAFIDVTLFDAFTRLKRIDVQVATPKGQLKRTLVAPARRVSLVR